jgi:hypothetical protein
VTTVARTVLDMAARVAPTRLYRLLDQVEIRELADYPSLDAVAGAHRATMEARSCGARCAPTMPAPT